MAYAKKCHWCQIFAPSIKVTLEELTSIISPWPLPKQGIDIIDLLPKAAGKVRFPLVAVNYFKKWA